MASLNQVILAGNLTADPELRYTPSGKAVGDLRLAVTTKFKDTEDTVFVSVTVWDRQAETCAEYLSKGSPVLIEGRLKLDTWEKDGQKHSKISVVARRVQFLGAPRNKGEEDRDQSQDDAPPRKDTTHPDKRKQAEHQEPPDDDSDSLPF